MKRAEARHLRLRKLWQSDVILLATVLPSSRAQRTRQHQFAQGVECAQTGEANDRHGGGARSDRGPSSPRREGSFSSSSSAADCRSPPSTIGSNGYARLLWAARGCEMWVTRGRRWNGQRCVAKAAIPNHGNTSRLRLRCMRAAFPEPPPSCRTSPPRRVVLTFSRSKTRRPRDGEARTRRIVRERVRGGGSA